jgi:NACalpha-BTF3-like transcription factor
MKQCDALIRDMFGPCARLVYELRDKQQKLEEKEKKTKKFALERASAGELRALMLEEKIERNKARSAVKHAQDDYFEALMKLRDCVINNC